MASLLVAIKNVEFIKEYRQSVVKELLKDREESSYVKTEKALAILRLSGKRPYDHKWMVFLWVKCKCHQYHHI